MPGFLRTAACVAIAMFATTASAQNYPSGPVKLIPGFQTSVWFGLWGPAKMPPELLAKIHADVSKALEIPETKQFFQTNSFERVDHSPEEFRKLIQSDLKHWSALINAVGAKID